MARIRTIKPEFPHSESLGRVSRDSRLLFVMLWTICDDEGRARANSRMLASLLFPYDDDATQHIPEWLMELEREHCIKVYVVDGNAYLHITNWTVHQKIDKPSKSRLPSPITIAKPRERSRKAREVSPVGIEASSGDLVPRTKDLKKPSAKGAGAPAVPDWIPETCWKHFSEMRHKIRKPLTPRAAELAIAKLERFKAEGLDIAAILDQSILNCWQDLWPPKINGHGQSEAELIGKVMAEAALRDQQNGEH